MILRQNSRKKTKQKKIFNPSKNLANVGRFGKWISSKTYGNNREELKMLQASKLDKCRKHEKLNMLLQYLTNFCISLFLKFHVISN